MKQDITFCGFCDAFRDMNREDNFSYNGKMALYNYLITFEEDCDTEIELDVIALCCEYTEYKDLEEIQANYNGIESMEDLQDHTQVIEFENGIIIQDY